MKATLNEWLVALGTPRQVVVESSAELIADVAARQAEVRQARQAKQQVSPSFKAGVTPVSMFSPERAVVMSPLVLLHRLGVVTTPPVPNLADICSTWAHFRYLWAFEIPAHKGVAHLRLSREAREIDFHQKSLLSDQMGVGMAATLLEAYFSAPLAADVSVAMEDPSWPIDLQDDSSPDYLFFDAARKNVFIVECKGTQGYRSASIDQLRRGTEQVPSLVFTDGRKAPPALVIATGLSKNGTRVFIIDPPDDQPHDRGAIARRVSKREWRVDDSVAFLNTAESIADSKILAFAADHAGAIQRLESVGVKLPHIPRLRPPANDFVETAEGVFQGIRQRLPSTVADVEVFQGLERSVRNVIADKDAAKRQETRQNFARKAKKAARDERAASVRPNQAGDAIVARSVGTDGTFLELTIRP